MSEELVVKKRGRPRKITVESLDAEGLEVKSPAKASKSARAKSTKAAPKTVESKKSAPKKEAQSITPKVAPAAVPSSSSKTIEPPSKKSTLPTSKPTADTPRSKTPITPETSKILEEVRKLPAKPEQISQSTKPSATNAASTLPKQQVTNSTATSKSPPPPKLAQAPSPISSEAPKINSQPSSNPTPPPKPKIPISALNSAIVSNISERAGARPNTPGSKALPKNYQSAARRVTMTIVALPIAIVTSYVLYQRLVLGEEKSLLVPPKFLTNESSKDVVIKESKD